MALTLQKRKFAEYKVFEGLNATQAAIKAGYSERSARKQGSRLNQCPDVQRYIKHLKETGEPKAARPTVNATTDDKPQTDPKEVLTKLLNDPDPNVRLRASQILMPYHYAKVEQTGKRQKRKDAAAAVATSSKFATLSNQKQ